jgi:hypothetical protein
LIVSSHTPAVSVNQSSNTIMFNLACNMTSLDCVTCQTVVKKAPSPKCSLSMAICCL